MLQRLIIVIVAALSTSCASLSKEECQQADWYLIGLEDGAQGYAVNRIGSHREACAKVGVTPDIGQYRAGLDEGYQRYCTPAKGYRVGQSGAQHQDVCSGEAAEAFNEAYSYGRDYYRLSQTLSELDTQLSEYHKNLAELADNTAYHEEQLVHHARNASERQQHLSAIKEIEQSIGNIQQALVYAERERAVLARDLNVLASEHRALGFNP
ncbi:MAG TPA: DUF2799 domain-containing protein [Cellvibrionaceae bacterium]